MRMVYVKELIRELEQRKKNRHDGTHMTDRQWALRLPVSGTRLARGIPSDNRPCEESRSGCLSEVGTAIVSGGVGSQRITGSMISPQRTHLHPEK